MRGRDREQCSRRLRGSSEGTDADGRQHLPSPLKTWTRGPNGHCVVAPATNASASLTHAPFNHPSSIVEGARAAYGKPDIADRVSDPSAEPDFAGDGFGRYFDHTLGTADGKMLFFDGAPDPTLSLWSATASLIAGTTYFFSYWMSAVTGSSTPVLAFSIGGVQDATTLTTGAAASWVNFATSFTPTTSGDVLLSIVDLNTERIGNDGALDDISLKFEPAAVDPGDPTGPGTAVPEPEEAALMAGGLSILAFMTRRRRGTGEVVAMAV
jgi:hypothetical protein